MALLELRGISKRFGGIAALDSVSLDVEAGEAVGLVGPNGAGKTTLFNCVLGLLRPDSGTISLAGVRIDTLPTFRRSRLGIARTFQRLELFTGMTPREHVLVALRVHGGGHRTWRERLAVGRPRSPERREADQLLSITGLSDVADVPVEALGLAYGRLVELARALASRPRLLLLDEPSSGLDEAETAGLVEVIGRVRAEQGTAVLLVEHDLEMVAAVVSRLVVLNFGRKIADGPLLEVMADPGVRQAYLGRAYLGQGR
ncbi:MAG TPA: ABC transporter ATP-binding protein [Acidimicrobiales bacterium]|nr:ABC transporter ATP-binding protein [Acidimicrobiales bacterium]